jgi:hypothetical protein
MIFRQFYWKILYLIKVFIKPSNFFLLTKSQNKNQENIFLKDISKHINKKTFVEIGFAYNQFNCIGLIENNFSGKLIDAAINDNLNISIMKVISKLIKKKITVINKFITLDNITEVFTEKELGCLSIDIDGNDFWILSKILENRINPELIILEYNTSFLNHSISIPYSKNFRYSYKIPVNCYHGASLTAFYNLLQKYDYSLVKSIFGTNAIFLNKDLIKKTEYKNCLPDEIFEECMSRNRSNKNSSREQYESIKHFPLVKV